MCGINGFNFKDQKLIQKMNKKITHRGPDDEGFYVDQNISLGHRRLSIIDLSDKGRQPIFNEDKSLVIIFNGEIYNYQELKKKIQHKHKFYSDTDTEVIIHLYEDLGPQVLQKLNGIFSFAIWDTQRQEMFIARDRMGIKPVYYYHRDNKFIFSSEIKAILEHSDVTRQVNTESMNHYFNLGFVPQPFTMFDKLYKLPSAHYLTLKDNQLNIKKYWEITDFEDIKSYTEAKEKVHNLVDDSIKHQLISDRPVGIFLSGGIDSNVVTGVAKKYLPKKIKTYSVGFDEQHGEKFNADFVLAEKTSQYHGTQHHQLRINEKDILANLEDVIYHIDEPINNASQTAVYLLAKMAKQDVAVVLSGGGGDELFGGYPRYYFNRLIDKWQSLPNFLQNKLLLKVLGKLTKKDLLAKFTSRGFERYKQFMFRDNQDIKRVLKSEILKENITERFYQEKFFDLKTKEDPGTGYPVPGSSLARDFTKYFGIIDRQTWLLDLGLVMEDKITMAHGLEERVPLLDHRLVELSAKIPTNFKIKGKDTKHIFKEAMRPYIAPHVFDEPKRGFFSPASEWLRTGLYDFSKQILSPDYCQGARDYLDFNQINQVFEDHVHKRKYNMPLVWGLLTWQIWFKKFMG